MKSFRIAPPVILVLMTTMVATAVFAQSDAQKPADKPVDVENLYSLFNKNAYNRNKGTLLASAEKMSDENYGFKPVDTVRSYGQIIGHLADAQYMFCSIAMGEKNPGLNIEKTKTAKADLIAALKESFAYCDKAYASMTDVSGKEIVTFFGMNMPKAGVLEINNMHDMEHYGNLVTYMRMKGIVPPSSEQQPPAAAKK